MGKAIDIWQAGVQKTSFCANRSREFKEGALAALLNLENLDTLGYRMRRCPYLQGTASFDAWFAGVREGKRLWNINNAKGRLRDKFA